MFWWISEFKIIIDNNNPDEKPYLNSDNWVKGDLKSVISEIIKNLSDDEKRRAKKIIDVWDFY